MQDEMKSASGGEKENQLNDSIEKLTKATEKSASIRWAFLRGIFYGLGFFIGSAILAAGLIYIFSKIEGWGFVGNFVEEIMNTSKKIK
ncbi:MAG: DUF5665 domain-containing protein [Patescibacteria group bacterium]|nr:DUF5665 domain-containing protein [Patescibacteria group bacterium]